MKSASPHAIEVRYTKEEFINHYPKRDREIAERYVAGNPKPTYGHEDFDAMYYLLPSGAGQVHVHKGQAPKYFYSQIDEWNMDRWVKELER